MTRSKIWAFALLAALAGNLMLFPIPRAQAAAASLFLSPSTGTYAIGSTFQVGVRVSSGDDEINAAEGTIIYDKDVLEVAGIAKGTAFLFWTTEPSSGGGSVRFGGGNPKPFKGAASNVINISFKAKRAGVAQVRFASGAVLANDGVGSNILTSMGSGSYTIVPQEEAPQSGVPAEEATKEEPKKAEEAAPKIDGKERIKPVVRSSTHPDQDFWYREGEVRFEWDLPAGADAVSLSFDQRENGDPGQESLGPIKEKQFVAGASGAWYLHIKFKDKAGWGTITHHKILIDKNPPSFFNFNIDNSATGSWPILHLESLDDESGIERYELFIGSLEHQSHVLESDKKTLELRDLEPGRHTVLIKVIDKAGNQRVETAEFVIPALPVPDIKAYPAEVKPADRFYMSGTAPAMSRLRIFIEQGQLIASSSATAGTDGNWTYIHSDSLPKGQYSVYVEAVNEIGMRSEPSPRKNFVVNPPIFVRIGSFIIDYFTAIVSAIFLFLLSMMSIVYLIAFVRKRLKRETIEAEEVAKHVLKSFREEMDEEFAKLLQDETKAAGRKHKEEVILHLDGRLDEVEEKILKEMKDVEQILK